MLELMIGLAILGVLAAIALPAYTDYRERLRVYQAVSEIGELQTAIDRYIDDNRAPPASLAQINRGGMLDPWGRPYQYLDLTTSPPGAARKNRNLVPINSSYDLYSVGKDGDSVGPLTAKASRDDVVRANDGKFIGLAQDYEP
ncbi:MAG: prepilin-type cleavage/methylation domain-containing protein [Burkholderiales bacterium]|nr:prepilin-type cleavage/methylation domain-containing protein [Burkholderiales bacterium]